MDLPALDTPFTVIDRNQLVINLAAHQARTLEQGIASRPHAKTHKIPELAKLQLAHGAVGITLATIGEAEVFVDAGITDIFLAYPLWLTPHKAERLAALAARARITMGVDSVAGVEQAARTLGSTTIGFLIEVDSGHHRSGCDPRAVEPLAAALAHHDLRCDGVFTYPGHSYHPEAKDTASMDEVEALTIATDVLESAGYTVSRRSGGSTPSLHSTQGSLTETRAGVYALGDAQQVELKTMTMEEVALSIVTTVVSSRENTAVVDAGSKVMGADKAAWATGHGRVLGYPEARIVAMSEHHATIVFPDSGLKWEPGDIVQVIPNHVCNAVNLVDSITVLSEGEPPQEWAVAARGKNS